MLIHVAIDSESIRGEYLGAAARLRRLSRTELLHMIVEKMLDDQLILAVLDDEGGKRYYRPRLAKALAKQEGRIKAMKLLKAKQREEMSHDSDEPDSAVSHHS